MSTARQAGIAVTYLIATSPDEVHCHPSCAFYRVDNLPVCDLWQCYLKLGDQQRPLRVDQCILAEELHERLSKV